ncbi:MAG: GtrA family protein [Clostridiales bacterium]|nr:GtrA family protein [Clostridiales bacterium]
MERSEEKRAPSRRAALGQFIKFALVGVLNTLVDLGVFRLLEKLFAWSLWVYFANVISYACGVLCSYFCNRAWTFRPKKKKTWREFLLFVLVNLISLGVSTGLIWLFKRFMPDETQISAALGFLPGFIVSILARDFVCKLLATPFVIVVNFIGNKLFVFKNAEKANADANGGEA